MNHARDIINLESEKNKKCTPQSDLLALQHQLYQPLGFICSSIVAETESTEYGAHTFRLNEFYVRFRIAKVTPTKIGQFVTLWKRAVNRLIQPYDETDLIDFVVICVHANKKSGQFVFPKSVLVDKNILSKNNIGGKRGFRIYPPWDITVNQQGKKTQKWQLDYFLNIPHNGPIDFKMARRLYS